MRKASRRRADRRLEGLLTSTSGREKFFGDGARGALRVSGGASEDAAKWRLVEMVGDERQALHRRCKSMSSSNLSVAGIVVGLIVGLVCGDVGYK